MDRFTVDSHFVALAAGLALAGVGVLTTPILVVVGGIVAAAAMAPAMR